MREPDPSGSCDFKLIPAYSTTFTVRRRAAFTPATAHSSPPVLQLCPPRRCHRSCYVRLDPIDTVRFHCILIAQCTTRAGEVWVGSFSLKLEPWTDRSTFQTQVQEFEEFFTPMPGPARAKWHGNDTLFIIFFGINDMVSHIRLNGPQREADQQGRLNVRIVKQ